MPPQIEVRRDVVNREVDAQTDQHRAKRRAQDIQVPHGERDKAKRVSRAEEQQSVNEHRMPQPAIRGKI